MNEFDLTRVAEKLERQRFVFATRCMSAMYARLFGRMKTEGCWKILVECVNQVEKKEFIDLLGVYKVQVQANPDGLLALEPDELKRESIEVLMKGIKKVALQNDWELQPFETAYQAVKKLNFTNQWIWRRPLSSPSRKHRAEVLVEHEVDEVLISLVIRDKAGDEVKRKQLLTEKPDEWFYAQHLGKLKWLSKDKVALYNKKMDKHWCAEVV